MAEIKSSLAGWHKQPPADYCRVLTGEAARAALDASLACEQEVKRALTQGPDEKKYFFKRVD